MLHDTEVSFTQKCSENFFSLSTTALLFVAPCLLTAEVLRRFHKEMPAPHVILESPCRVTCNYVSPDLEEPPFKTVRSKPTFRSN